MSVSGEFPPGSVLSGSNPYLTWSKIALSKQENVQQGDQLKLNCEWAFQPLANRPLTKNFLIEVYANARTSQRVFIQSYNPAERTAQIFVNYPHAGGEGSTLMVRISVNYPNNLTLNISTLNIPLNQGFGGDPNQGGAFIFGDLSATVNVVNVSQSRATVEGVIQNNTAKTGTVAVYIEVRDPASQVSIVNNAPLNNQVMAANGQLFANLLASGLEAGKTYEARVFALDETHTIPLSAIATEQFTTGGVGPGPGPGEPLTFGDIAPGLTVENITQTDANVVATMTNLTGKSGAIGIYIEIQDPDGSTRVINEPIPLHSISANATVSATFFLHLLDPGTTYTARTFALDASLTVPLSPVASVSFTTLQPGQEPPPSSSGFQLIALPLFMGALSYVWPDEERRKKRYSKFRAVVMGTARASRRELDKATRALIRGVNRR
jgi:hypothetical protein